TYVRADRFVVGLIGRPHQNWQGDHMQSLLTRLVDRDMTAVYGKGVLFALLALALLAPPRAVAQEGLPGVKPEEVGVSQERLRRINDVVQRHIDEHRLAGAVTLVARR